MNTYLYREKKIKSLFSKKRNTFRASLEKKSPLMLGPISVIFSFQFLRAKREHFLLLPRGYQRFYTVKSVTYIISTLGNFEITKTKATKTSILLIGGLGTSTKHSLFSQITKNSTIAKHRMFVFALCTCLVPLKLTCC